VKSISDQKLNLPAHAPVMVLPGAHLFPNALLPLYIFEPRYREMLAWSLERHRMFCIAPMRHGITEARSIGDFHHVVGLGLVRACVAREDGTSHLILQGVARVRFTGFLQDAPFRIAEMRELPSEAEDADENENLTAKLLEICTVLRAGGANVPDALDKQLSQIEDPALLSDIIAHTFLRDSERRQCVFEELRVGARTRMLIRFLLGEMPGDGDAE
jgi:Lon protease-like protein